MPVATLHRLLFGRLSLLALACIPSLAVAQESLTRREGFQSIWASIRRPAYETRDDFDDVKDGAPGSLEINYARSRGLLDEIPNFYPDDGMVWEDAVIWLMRTRNVADVDDMGREDLPALLARYPIVGANQDLSGPISRDELTTLILQFDTMLREEVHEASLYGEKWHGKGTAFGEPFDMHAMTAAHRTFPHNTLVKVTNVANGKSVTVRINDRGPFVEGRDMDLSLAAFLLIEERSKGILNARFERLGDVSLVSGCSPLGERREQQRISRDLYLTSGVPHRHILGEELQLKANGSFVVRSIRHPDGSQVRVQDFVLPEETFIFTPQTEGEYVFSIGNGTGRQRQMKMKVVSCTNP